MSAPVVEVVGLKALVKDLNKMSDPRAGDLIKAMQQAGKQAMQPLADAVRSAYPSKTGNLRGTVRVTASRTGAAVRVGKKVLPYAGPVDFGGWPEARDFVRDGRYLYPTARMRAPQTAHQYELAIEHVVETFPWTNTTANPKAVHD